MFPNLPSSGTSSSSSASASTTTSTTTTSSSTDHHAATNHNKPDKPKRIRKKSSSSRAYVTHSLAGRASPRCIAASNRVSRVRGIVHRRSNTATTEDGGAPSDSERDASGTARAPRSGTLNGSRKGFQKLPHQRQDSDDDDDNDDDDDDDDDDDASRSSDDSDDYSSDDDSGVAEDGEWPADPMNVSSSSSSWSAARGHRSGPPRCTIGTEGPFYDPYPPHRHNYRMVSGGLYGVPITRAGGWTVLHINGIRVRGRARIGRGGRLIIDRMKV